MSTYGRRSGFGFGSYGSFFGRRTSQSGFGRIGGGSNRGSSRKSHRGGSSSGGSSGYRNCCNSFEKKIESYRCLVQQTAGGSSARFGRPSPATLNSFANLINKGMIVQTVSAAQVARWARSTHSNFKTRSASTSACKNVLCKKFGRSAIKAVARTKSGSFMVATTPTVNGRSFSFPK